MTDASSDPAPAEPAASGRQWGWPGGLSARLLVLTALLVLVAGLMILIPSLAGYQEARYYDRVRAAELASLAVEASPARTVSGAMAAQLLNGAGVVSLAVQSGGVRRLLIEAPRMTRTPELVDLRQRNLATWLVQPFLTLFSGDWRRVRVVARPRFRDGDFIEVVIPNAPLRAELGRYLLSIVWVALFIGVMAGAGLYLTLNAFLVAPIQRLTAAMERFRADPEAPGARIALSGRRDEIGRAEAELDRMQADLRTALNSRARMAALGEAVAKINHDLRNMLSSAQLASDRLGMLGDPRVSQALPRLERALDRAITLASDVLDYGKTQEAAPQPSELRLAAALEAAAEDAGLADKGVSLDVEVNAGAQVLADPEQLHRILVNLLRNARQAIAQGGRSEPGRVRVTLNRSAGRSLIRISDNGPGVPERALPKLFQPFAGSGRPGGAGLGLAISRELAQGHGGDLVLAENSPTGATFELSLPGTPDEAVTPPAARQPEGPATIAAEPRPRAAGRRRPPGSRPGP